MKKQSLAKLFAMVGKYWPILLLAYLLTFIDKIMDSVVLSSIIRAIADGAVAGDTVIVLRAAIYLALVGVARSVLPASAMYLTSLAGGRAALEMRSSILGTSLNATEETATADGTGSTVSVMINDIEAAKQGYAGVMNFIGQMFLVATTITTLFLWSWPMALATICFALVCLGSGLSFAGPLRRLGGAYQGSLASVADMSANLLTGMPVVKSLQAEKAMSKRFRLGAEAHFHTAQRRGTLMGFQSFVMNLMPYLSFAGLIVVSGALTFRHQISPGAAVGLVQLSTRALFPFASIGYMWAGLQGSLAAFDRVCQAMGTPQEEEGLHAAGTDAPATAGVDTNAVLALADTEAPKVTFRDVSFRYEDRQVLDRLSLEVPAGGRMALVGPSGSGKSTVLRILLGLHAPQGGSVELDGRDILTMSLGELRRIISLVPQEPWLFPGTIQENIALGSATATREEVEHAAALANAHDFIARLPGRYDTMLDERGSNLSGGEKQRICLARAFLKGSRLLLLDEPTSSVDGESERLIAQALAAYYPGRTVVIVSHNLDMCKNVDVVVHLEDGKLVSAALT